MDNTKATPLGSKRNREDNVDQNGVAKLTKSESSSFEPEHYPPPKKRTLEEYKADISAMFKKNDKNGDGTIDKSEFEGLLWDIFQYIDPDLKAPDMKEDKETVRKLIDRNHDHAVSEQELFDSLKEWIPSIGGGKKALIIVDLQNDFVDENGSMGAPGRVEAVLNTNKLREKFDFDVVALTRDWHPRDHCSFFSNHSTEDSVQLFGTKTLKLPDGTEVEQVLWPDHCVQGEWGAEFCAQLTIKDTDFIVDKGTEKEVDSYSGFFDNCKLAETPLQKYLKHRDVGEVYVVGVAMDYCVGSTALDAACCGFTAYLVQDCSRMVSRHAQSGRAGVGEVVRRGQEESWQAMKAALEENEVEIINSAQVPMQRKQTSENALEAARRLVRRRERKVERVNAGHNASAAREHSL